MKTKIVAPQNKMSGVERMLGRTAWAVSLALIFFGTIRAQQVQPDEFSTCENGCQSVVLSGGSQFAVEAGYGVNSSTIMFYDQRGDKPPRFSGFPPESRRMDRNSAPLPSSPRRCATDKP
jgi:hypothetical protein